MSPVSLIQNMLVGELSLGEMTSPSDRCGRLEEGHVLLVSLAAKGVGNYYLLCLSLSLAVVQEQ